MRVTDNTNYDVLHDSIRRSKERMEVLQRQQATLKKISTPSDDPVGTAKLLEIRTDKMNNDQFQMNAKLAQTYLDNSDHALNDLADLVVRAKEIAISQASGASSSDDTRLGVAEEVTQLYQQAVATANTRIGDRYLFGGYKTHRPPVDPDGKYLGDEGKMMVEIAKDVFLTMNVPGTEIFNAKVSKPQNNKEGETEASPEALQGRSPASLPLELGNQPSSDNQSNAEQTSVFNELQNLRISLLTGDLDGIRNTLDRFDQIHSNLIANRAKIGSRIQGLQSAGAALERHNITNAQLSSNIEDADMAQVVSDLAKEETVFRSALHSSQKLVQPSLMDFIK